MIWSVFASLVSILLRQLSPLLLACSTPIRLCRASPLLTDNLLNLRILPWQRSAVLLVARLNLIMYRWSRLMLLQMKLLLGSSLAHSSSSYGSPAPVRCRRSQRPSHGLSQWSRSSWFSSRWSFALCFDFLPQWHRASQQGKGRPPHPTATLAAYLSWRTSRRCC